MIEFTATDGSTQTAEVWSNGPVARSVWALLDDGTPVAIKLATGLMHQQIDFVSAPIGAMVPDRWTKTNTPGLTEYTRARYVADHVAVSPAVGPKAWRELTADQRAPLQLALV